METPAMSSGAEAWEAEECWVLVGARLDRAWKVRFLRRTDGGLASVEADWAWALQREEEQGDVVGFLHSHPPGAGHGPSRRDVRTMRAWCSALGKPLLCISEHGTELGAHRFDDDESEGAAIGPAERTRPDELTIGDLDAGP